MKSLFRVWIPVAACAAAFGGAGLRAQEAALENFSSTVENYNLVALSTTATSTFNSFGDTEGPLAIAGNLSLEGGSIADQPSNFGVDSNPTLFVSGSLTLSGETQLESGYASLKSATGYTWNSSTENLTSNSNSGNYLNTTNANSTAGSYETTSPLTNPGPSGWTWTTVTSNLKADSTSLGALTTNGTISVSGGSLEFTPNTTPTAGSTVVFTLNASLLTSSGTVYNGTSFSNVSISVPSDVNYVINVTNAAGDTIFGSGVNFNSGTNDDELLWNFEGTGSVTLGGDYFYGAILAPQMNVSNLSNTVLDGQVVANSYTDTDAELHFDAFSAATPAPEPLTFALWAVGLCGLAIVWRRRQAC